MRTAFNIAAEASNGMLYYFVYIAIEPLGPTKPSLNTRQSRRKSAQKKTEAMRSCLEQGRDDSLGAVPCPRQIFPGYSVIQRSSKPFLSIQNVTRATLERGRR